MVWWQSPMINLKLRRQINEVILSGPAMDSHCCTILYPEMRIRNLIAFAQQMSWTQILMIVSTLRPGLQWLREFGNKVSKIIYKRDNLVSRIHGPIICSIVHITVHWEITERSLVYSTATLWIGLWPWLFSLATFSLVKYFHCTGGGKITTRHKKTTQNHKTK